MWALELRSYGTSRLRRAIATMRCALCLIDEALSLCMWHSAHDHGTCVPLSAMRSAAVQRRGFVSGDVTGRARRAEKYTARVRLPGTW